MRCGRERVQLVREGAHQPSTFRGRRRLPRGRACGAAVRRGAKAARSAPPSRGHHGHPGSCSRAGGVGEVARFKATMLANAVAGVTRGDALWITVADVRARLEAALAGV